MTRAGRWVSIPAGRRRRGGSGGKAVIVHASRGGGLRNIGLLPVQDDRRCFAIAIAMDVLSLGMNTILGRGFGSASFAPIALFAPTTVLSRAAMKESMTASRGHGQAHLATTGVSARMLPAIEPCRMSGECAADGYPTLETWAWKDRAEL